MNENQLTLMLTLLSSISAFLAILLMMLYRFWDQRRKLNVSTTYLAELIQSNNNDVSFNQMYISINVLNIGSQNLFIYSPCIKLSHKVNGIDLYQVATPDEKFPQKIESGDEYSKKTSLKQIVRLLENDLKLKAHDKISFQVTDTFDKKHNSKPIKLSKLKVELTKITQV